VGGDYYAYFSSDLVRRPIEVAMDDHRVDRANLTAALNNNSKI
jgi:hypothetical protein